MALNQYDVVLTQNVSSGGTEFTERPVLMAKGTIITASGTSVPTALAVGNNTQVLTVDSTTATGLKWADHVSGHTQNTDTGTTNNTFTIDSDGTTGQIILDADNAGGNYTTTIQNTTQSGNIVITLPSTTSTLATVAYVDGVLAANDAMIFKGTIGTGGTHTIAAFNALTTYNAGWTYRVIEAGTIRGKVCEIGDLVIVLVDRTGSGNLDTDFTVAQTNIDGAVVGPTSTTDGYLVLFDGTTGKLIKAGTGAPGTMAYETATNYVAKSLFDANTILYATSDNTPLALTVSEQTVIGRKTGGNIAALTPAEIMNVITVAAPATKSSTGTLGQIAFDDNYMYRCTATNTWKRSAMATNW